MHYFAKLIVGRTYMYKGLSFAYGVEVPVTEEVAKYLQTVVEKRLEGTDRQIVVKDVSRFVIRTEDLTVQEKVTLEVSNVPETLKPKKPGPKPAAN